VFTSCFDDPEIDERRFADAVVGCTGATPHRTFPTAEGFLTELPSLLHAQEEPFAGTSVYAQWCVMREIHKQGLKVVLDGQGSDEQLLGYGKFYLFYLGELLRRRNYRRFVVEAAALAHAPRFLRSLHVRHGLRYLGPMRFAPATSPILRSHFVLKHRERRFPTGLGAGLAERIRLDLTRFSLPVLLRYEDKSSMAFSVESRVPFVDHVLIEHVAALPINYKLRAGWTKFVLRGAVENLVPDSIRMRRDKIGFATPEERWLKTDLAEAVDSTFAGARFISRYTDTKALRASYAEFRRGRAKLTAPEVFFRYFVLEHWAKLWFEDSL